MLKERSGKSKVNPGGLRERVSAGAQLILVAAGGCAPFQAFALQMLTHPFLESCAFLKDSAGHYYCFEQVTYSFFCRVVCHAALKERRGLRVHLLWVFKGELSSHHRTHERAWCSVHGDNMF